MEAVLDSAATGRAADVDPDSAAQPAALSEAEAAALSGPELGRLERVA